METPQPQPKRKVFKRTPTTPPLVQSGFKGDFTPELMPVAIVVPVSPQVAIEVPSVPILTADQEKNTDARGTRCIFTEKERRKC